MERVCWSWVGARKGLLGLGSGGWLGDRESLGRATEGHLGA